jgi:hypothetical protein
LNNLSENNPEGFETFRRTITDYFESLKKSGVKDKYFAIPLFEKILYLLFTIVLAIPSLVGAILNFIPMRIAKNTATKKVKKMEFFDSVYIGSAALLGFIYSILLWIICSSIFGWVGIFIAIGIRLLGYLFLYWQEAALNTLYWFIILFTPKGRNMSKPLRSQRKFILDYFG